MQVEDKRLGARPDATEAGTTFQATADDPQNISQTNQSLQAFALGCSHVAFSRSKVRGIRND